MDEFDGVFPQKALPQPMKQAPYVLNTILRKITLIVT